MPFGNRHAALILIPLCVAFLVVAGCGPMLSAHALSQSTPPATLPRAALLPTPLGTSSQPAYDEQLGETFTQSFTSVQYDVIAVAQQDPSTGYGPAYLLNGLSNKGYWYQVGLSWNWCGPISGVCTGYVQGFNMNFEVFDSGGSSVYPTNGGGGLARYSGPVNAGDTVVLNLYFSNGEVFMLSKDLNTSAEATIAYGAEGATSFVGLPSEPANSNGFFTGLMTEWYHASPFYSNIQGVQYTDSSFALTSAWMWMDEFNSQNRSQVLFEGTPGITTYSNPSQLQEFSANGATEYSDAYEFVTGAINEDFLTVNYSVQGGGSGYLAPILNYESGGQLRFATLSSNYTTYILDPGSYWSITATLGGSTGEERWQTGQATSGSATSSETTTFVYFNQYLVNASYSVAYGGTVNYPPLFSCTQFGEEVSFDTSPGGNVAWVDAGCSFSFTNPLSGSNSTERWQALDVAGTITGPASLSPVYYDQRNQVLSYSVVDGGTPSPPSATGWLFGSVYSTPLTMTPTGYWFDANAPYPNGNISFNSTISGGSNERWVTPIPGFNWNAPTNLVYFHQYDVLFYYTVANGVAPTFRGASAVQTLACEQMGGPSNYPLTASPSSYWCDSGTTVSATNPAFPSTATERWSDNGQNFTISGPGSDNFVYYHQFLVTLSYSLIDGGLPSPPSFNGTADDMVISGQLSSSPTAFWLDNGSALDVPAMLNFPASALQSNSERWVANETFPLTVDAAINETVGYQHQFYVTLVSAKTGGGSVSPPSEWFNATGTLQLTASPSSGWSLWRWDGSGPASYSGNATTTSVQVEGAINETAVFWPGLNVVVGADGTAGYSYAAVKGVATQITLLGPVLPPGQHTIYVPPGTEVTLTEQPSSFLYSFAGWTISKTSGSSTVALVVNAPESEEATFSYNLVAVGAILGAIVAVVAAAVFVFYRRKGAHKSPAVVTTSS